MTKLSQWVSTMASRTPGSTVSLVGQGSFLDKPSLHVVGYMGKNSPSVSAPHDGWCPVCKTKGQTQALKTYRINFTQSIFLCTNPQCIFPLGYTSLDNIISNTADLKKNSSPKKQKKRNLSDLSPTPLPNEKRPKTGDLINGDSHSVQADLCPSVPGFSALEHVTSSPTRLEHGHKEISDSQMQNVLIPTNSFCSKSSFAAVPLGSPSSSASGKPNELLTIHDGQQEVLPNGDLEVISTLNNGLLLPLSSDTGLMANAVDKEQETVTESTNSFSEEHMMNGLAFSSDLMPSYISPLQNILQECQVKENLPNGKSSFENNIDSGSDIASGLPQPCEYVKESLCVIQPSLLPLGPTMKPKENLNDSTNDDVEASSRDRKASLSIKNSPLETSLPTKLQNGLKECPDSPMQSISEPTNSLCDKSSLPDVSLGSPSSSVPGTPNRLSTIHNDQQEALQNVDLKVIDTSNRGSLIPLSQDAGMMANKMDNEHKNVTAITCSLSEEHTTNILACALDHTPSCTSPSQNSLQDSQIMENSLKEMPTPQCDIESDIPQLCEFVKDSLCLIPPPVLLPEELMENLNHLTNKDVEVASCNREVSLSIQESHKGTSGNTVSPELQHEGSDQQIHLQDVSPPVCPEDAENSFEREDVSAALQAMQISCKMTEASQSLEDVQQKCPADIRPLTNMLKPVLSSPCPIAEDTRCSTLPLCELETCQLQTSSKNSSDIPMDLTYVMPKESMVSKEDPAIPVCLLLIQELMQSHKQRNPFNFTQDILPVNQGEETALKKACDSPTTTPSVNDQAYTDAELSSISPKDVLQECPAEDGQDIGFHKSTKEQPCPAAEGVEKNLTTLPICEVEEAQQESLSEDDLDIPLDLSCAKQKESVVNIANPLLPIPNLSLVQELEQPCQKMDSDSDFIRDVLTGSRREEDTCDSPTASVQLVKDQAYTDASAISHEAIPGNDLSKKIDTAQDFKKNNVDTPADSVDVHPVCHKDASLEKVCEPLATSASNTRGDCNSQRDDKSPNKMLLLGPQILLQDCLKCHCGMNRTSCNLQTIQVPEKDPAGKDGDTFCGGKVGTECEKMLVHGDAKWSNKMPLSGPKILLKDCMKCHCGMRTPSRSSQSTRILDKNSAPEVGTFSCEDRAITSTNKVSAQLDSLKDSNTVVKNATAATSECESLAQQKKNFYENTILPDLLLDLQPEHRLDEPLSAVPSPDCDASMSVAVSSVMESTKQDVRQNGQDRECDNVMETEPADALRDSVQDDSKLSNSLETSLNNEVDDDSDAMETKTDSPAQVNKASALRKLKPSEKRLQWKNRHSLCWLDCVLSILVQSDTLKRFVSGGHLVGKESIICNLFTRYQEATELFLKTLKKRSTAQKRPKYEKCMSEIRTSIFEKLQPLLKCRLGKKDSPVFAFPLLLRLDPEIERLYMFSITWRFKCEACGHKHQQRGQKSMATFTKVLPDWHPLNAAHIGPCNKCQNTKQKRTMVLEKLNSIFMVHFVEGLPSADLKEYSFQFQGHSYEVKAVIKYKNSHFSSWISFNDGTWLESDDLRGSFCRRHQQFRVGASDIHIVIWERSGEIIFEDNVQIGAVEQDLAFNLTSVSVQSEDDCFSSMDATEPCPLVAPSAPLVAPTAPLVALNTSGPLAGMEGYADDDIITLTLVEVPLDENGRPIETFTTDTCTSQQVENQGEGTPSPQPAMSTEIQPESQEDCTVTSPISSEPNSDTVPLRNCSVVLSPIKQNPLKPTVDAIATSTPAQQPCKLKSSGVGNWMTRMIQKDRTILNADLLYVNKKTISTVAAPPLKVTDTNVATKKAQNFNSFHSKSKGKSNILRSEISSSNTASQSFSIPKENGALVAKTSPAPAASGFRLPESSASDYSKQLSKEGRSSMEDKIRKLRLKLLKKLKAKKNELATLEMLSKLQEGGSFGDQAQGAPKGSFNRKEHLQGFLQELQEHIDNADNESVCTLSSATSMCSSPGDAEFFAELFSPSPVNQPNASSYLEMLADGCGISATNQSQQANDHQPLGNVFESASGNSCLTSNTLNTSTRDESLNIMSNSTMAVLNEDNDYFDFDDYF